MKILKLKAVMKIKWVSWILMGLLAGMLAIGCRARLSQSQLGITLAEARGEFQTIVQTKSLPSSPAPLPPVGLMRKVKYPSSVDELLAYISEPPTVEAQYPAVIWVFGGFSNDIDETAWLEAVPEND